MRSEPTELEWATDHAEYHDVVVIGAGPAGISCALELHENRVDYLLLDRCSQVGGQLPDIKNTIRNFAARYWQSGNDLRDDMDALCQQIGINMRLNEHVDRVDLRQKKLICTAGKNLQCRQIFLATGSRLRELDVAGAELLSDRLIYDVEVNESRLIQKTVLIVGGGDNAFMDAAWLAKRGCKVYLVHRSANFRARPDVIAEAVNHPNVVLRTDCRLVHLSTPASGSISIDVLNIKSGSVEKVTADFIVVKIGYAPNSELFSQQLTVTDGGYIAVDALGRTSIDGVFAGGDVAAPAMFSIARSVGHGVVAARMIAMELARPTP